MAQKLQLNTYTQGYSKFTTATQQTRTTESDADFLVPHIKKTDRLLDVGCGPGTITTGLAKYASEGSTIGIDLSPGVIQKAKALTTEANVPSQGPGSVTFEEGNVLERLAYPDESFDVVFASQVFGYLVPSPDVPMSVFAHWPRSAAFLGPEDTAKAQLCFQLYRLSLTCRVSSCSGPHYWRAASLWPALWRCLLATMCYTRKEAPLSSIAENGLILTLSFPSA